ncbi:MAG: hypothetical protein ABIP85_20900, partial [Chthoniobacteraceae bacterium]
NTTKSTASMRVCCRFEDADYEPHSIAMLNRIAAALHRRVEIRFMPLRGAKQPRRAEGLGDVLYDD